MAREAGIMMSECQLYQESGRYHFITKRFDRDEAGRKIHMQTLGALAHYDYNMPGAHSYEQAAHIIEQLRIGQKAVEQFFRRMVFNIVMRNQDDHVKNISFLMSRTGQWSLAPAYDITFASDEANYWLARHQMSMNGKTEQFEIEDFYECGKAMNLSKARVGKILDEVRAVTLLWEQCAQKAFLKDKDMETVKKQFLQI